LDLSITAILRKSLITKITVNEILLINAKY